MSFDEGVFLDPKTDRVRRLTAASLERDTNPRRLLEIRCRACGGWLGAVLATSHGPGFASRWEEDVPHVTMECGRPLSPAAADRVDEEFFGPITHQSGPPISRKLANGVVALLTLPPGVSDDYPALLVRCAKHGDAVLARSEVLERAALGASWKVDVSFPFTPHRRHDPEMGWWPESQTSTRQSTQTRGRTWGPPDDVPPPVG